MTRDAAVVAVRDRVRRAGRFGLVVAWLAWLAMAAGMVGLAGVVGPLELLEAPLARGLTLHLVFASIPFALGVGHMLGAERASLDAWAASVGVSASSVHRLVVREALARATSRLLVPVVALSLLAAALSPSPLVAVSRVSAGALLGALGVAATWALVGAAALVARVSSWPRLWLLLALVVPSIVAGAAGWPRWSSPTGAYGVARDFVLDRAERSAHR